MTRAELAALQEDEATPAGDLALIVNLLAAASGTAASLKIAWDRHDGPVRTEITGKDGAPLESGPTAFFRSLPLAKQEAIYAILDDPTSEP